MKYDEYKKRTLSEKHGSVNCKECKDKLMKSIVTQTCIIETCRKEFEY